MTFLIARLALWGVPESIRKPLATLIAIAALIALCGAAWTTWLHFHDKGVIAENEAAIEAQLNARASDAAVAASEAAQGTKGRIDTDTQRGIAAASGSADPLGAAFKEWK